jgi:hypothetical protein
VTLARVAPRSTLVGVTASDAGAAGAVEVVVTEVEVLVEVEGAVVVGDVVGATEVAAPATTGPPDRPPRTGHRRRPFPPSPTPTPPASSIAAMSPATTMRRRPFPAPADAWP